MKHLLKKKSLLSIILILILMFTLCACSGSSPLAKDEDILVGYWESELKDLEDGTPLFSMTFNKDGTGVFDFMIEVNITDYSCEDGTLHMDFDNGNTLSFKYRFNDDKSAVYLYDDEYPDEYKFNRTDVSQAKDDTSTESNAESSDSEKESNSNKEGTGSNTDTNESAQNSTTDESDYTPFGYDENIIGYWETWEDDILYSVWFNKDGTGYLSLDSDYNIVSFCCVDGYIIADFDDDSSAEIPYRFNKDKTALYLTLSDGETKFDKGELGIG